MNEEESKTLESVLSELVDLRSVNSIRAKYSLIGLALVFCVSLLFFLFADRVTSTNSDNPLDIRELESAVEKELANLVTESGSLRGEMDKYERESATEKIPETIALQSDARVRSYSELKELYEGLNNRKMLLTKELETLQSRRLEELKLRSGSQAIEGVIATSITRIGAVLLAVFMMQILLSFYRYYMRLSSFYGSKIVAVKSLDAGDKEGLNSLISSISLDGIDFGKEPQPPLEKIIELLKANR